MPGVYLLLSKERGKGKYGKVSNVQFHRRQGFGAQAPYIWASFDKVSQGARGLEAPPHEDGQRTRLIDWEMGAACPFIV